MTCYPEAQKLAQEEIDRVIGNGRLPTLSDRPHLPLIVSYHIVMISLYLT